MERPSLTLVPACVGLEIGAAHRLALDARVVLVDPDPALELPAAGIVTAQRPTAGTRVPPGEVVLVHVGIDPDGPGGGGSAPEPVGPIPQDPAGSR